MSQSIRAISRATFVDCNGFVDEEAGESCDHDEAAMFPLGREGLKPGCYVPGRGGRSFSFEIGYSAYAEWFDELYRLVYGMDANALCEKYRHHRGKPFIEFLDIPNLSEGDTIGLKTSTKLHGDFVAFAAKARKHFVQAENRAWMWDVYRVFRKAFKIASDRGFVCYW